MSSCKTCSHGSRGAIENALSRGISYRTVARRWGLGVGSISRHNRSHVPAALRDRIAARRLGGVEKSLAELKREPKSLVEFLFRDNSFPWGAFLMTGTGVIPPDSFTLQIGDRIRITIDPIGTLENIVAQST